MSVNFDYLICPDCKNLAPGNYAEGDGCVCGGKFTDGIKYITTTQRALQEVCKKHHGDDECPMASHDDCPFADQKIFDADGICDHLHDGTEWECWQQHYLTLAQIQIDKEKQ